MKRYVLTLTLILISGCRSTGGGASPARVRAPATNPPASAPLPDSIRWVRGSAEYIASLEQVYRVATARVTTESTRHQPATWAVVLDADETLLNNSLYQEERARAGLPFSAESWDAWVRRKEATPLPGAAAFLARVRALGGRIAVVTNRLESQCADTRAVLQTSSLVSDAVLCQPDGQPGDKNPRFQVVESGRAFGVATPVTVVAYLGDNILDFPGLAQTIRRSGPDAFADFGVRFFVIPNPMYGSWQ